MRRNLSVVTNEMILRDYPWPSASSSYLLLLYGTTASRKIIAFAEMTLQNNWRQRGPLEMMETTGAMIVVS